MRSEKRKILAIGLSMLLVFQLLSVKILGAEIVDQTSNREAFDYAMFSASKDTDLTINGSDISIKGGIHTNANFVFQGSKLAIDNLCEATGKIYNYSSSATIANKLESSPIIEMSDVIEDIKSIASVTADVYSTDKQYYGDGIVIQKSLIAEGCIEVSGSKLTSNGYIIAKDNISFNTSITESGAEKGIVVCSETGNITFNGWKVNLKGLIYAPKGTVTINSANFSLKGRIIADKIIFRGSYLNVESGEVLNLIEAAKVPVLELTDDNGCLEFNLDNVDSTYNYALDIKTNGGNFKQLLSIDLAKPIYASKEPLDGIYKYQVSAVTKTGKKVYSNTISYMVSPEYTGQIELDADEDGIDADMEAQIGTDVNNADSDADGLLDGYEYFILKTSPIMSDTDENGITDADEDFDNDGLNSLAEYKIFTNPYSSDTDEDLLEDGTEVNIYKTNPLLYDTDGDLMSDGDELNYGTNPLKTDSNNNGIKDGDEKYLTTIEVTDDDIDPNVKPSVSLELSVEQFGTLGISKYKGEFLVDEMPGYIGSAYDFNIFGSIEKATISFSFNKSLLEQPDFQPAIYYYDEENMKLVELPNQTIDSKNAVVSVGVEHFSTYILLNKIAFDKVWEEQIKGGNDSGDGIKPLNVVLVIDSSGSMTSNDRNNIRKIVAKEFVTKLGENDKAAVIDFDGSIKSVLELTSNKADLNTAIDKIDSDGGTNILPALNKSLQQFINVGDDYNKSIILLSDGDDGTTITYYTTLIQSAISSKVTIYTVGLGTGVKAGLLKEIATQTGGKYYQATTAEDLYDIYDDVAGETIDYSKDTDGDGISDYHESRIRLGNGIIITTDPNNADTDGDGISDGEEINLNDIIYEDDEQVNVYSVNLLSFSNLTSAYMSGSLPLAAVNQYISSYKYYSNPTKQDTDEDGYNDNVDKYPKVKYKAPIILLHGRSNIDGNTYAAYGAKTPISEDKWNKHYISDNIDSKNNIIHNKTRTKDSAWFSDNSKEYYDLESHNIEKVVNKKETSDSEIYKDAGKTREPKNLAFSLVNDEKYEINKNLFALNYPNTDLVWKNADLLKWYVTELSKNKSLNPTKDNSEPTKFILIGRDTGGLVARYYIENLYGKNNVEKMITIDTEHKGIGNRNESEPIGFDLYGLGKMYGGDSYQAPAKKAKAVQAYASKYQTGLLKPETNTTVPYFRIGTTVSKDLDPGKPVLGDFNLDILKIPVANSVKSFIKMKIAEKVGNEYQLLSGDKISANLTGVFKNSATVQSKVIEKLSIEASLLAYDDYLRVNRNNDPYFLTKMLKNLGFTNYWNSNNYGNNIEHDISYTIAHRTITEGGINYNLIAVVLRGTDSVEWMGNFDISEPVVDCNPSLPDPLDKYRPESDEHFSFGYANRVLLEKIHEYCNTYSLNNDISKNKIWITGHSRGAAVANLAAAYLTMGKDSQGNTNKRLAQPQNIYAYTFATPNVTTNIQNDNCDNIFNFLNSDDFVTLVPFTNWGYSRYGKDIGKSYNTEARKNIRVFSTCHNMTGESKFVGYPEIVDSTKAELLRLTSFNNTENNSSVNAYYNLRHTFYEDEETLIRTYTFTHDRLASAFQYSNKPFGQEMQDVTNMITQQITVYYLPGGANSDFGEFCKQLAKLSQTDAIAYAHQAQTYYTITNLKN